jgi:hypothetical protein
MYKDMTAQTTVEQAIIGRATHGATVPPNYLRMHIDYLIDAIKAEPSVAKRLILQARLRRLTEVLR